jgi:hypothetical protein
MFCASRRLRGLAIQPVDHLSIDLSGIYIAYSTKVERATKYNAGPGTYASNSGRIALSATYRM